MEPSPFSHNTRRQELSPKRRRSLNEEPDEREIDPTIDADADDIIRKRQESDGNTPEVPATPTSNQTEIGIHAPTPEMDERDQEEQDKYKRRRKKEEEGETNPRGWEEWY